MVIDYSTPEGKLRMRLGDTSDLPYLPSSVYTAVYAENNNNLVAATKACGLMILAQLSYKVHRKLSLQLEVFGKEAFDSYMSFLLLTVNNPAFMDISPLPSSTTLDQSINPLVQFSKDWNRNFYSGTSGQELALDADISPNTGDRYGPLGNLSTNTNTFGTGWTLV